MPRTERLHLGRALVLAWLAIVLAMVLILWMVTTGVPTIPA